MKDMNATELDSHYDLKIEAIDFAYIFFWFLIFFKSLNRNINIKRNEFFHKEFFNFLISTWVLECNVFVCFVVSFFFFGG